jgi:hypothetical protein
LSISLYTKQPGAIARGPGRMRREDFPA